MLKVISEKPKDGHDQRAKQITTKPKRSNPKDRRDKLPFSTRYASNVTRGIGTSTETTIWKFNMDI